MRWVYSLWVTVSLDDDIDRPTENGEIVTTGTGSEETRQVRLPFPLYFNDVFQVLRVRSGGAPAVDGDVRFDCSLVSLYLVCHRVRGTTTQGDHLATSAL